MKNNFLRWYQVINMLTALFSVDDKVVESSREKHVILKEIEDVVSKELGL